MSQEPRFNATVWVEHPALMQSYVAKLSNKQTLTTAELAEFSQFTNELLYYQDHQRDFVPVGYYKSGTMFVPNSELVAGMPGAPPPSAPPPSGGGGMGNTDPNSWPNAMQAPMWGGERRTNATPTNDVEPCGYDDPRTVICVPITIPPGPGPNGEYAEPMLGPSVSSYESRQTTRQAILSWTPGDFANPIAFSEGNTASPSVQVGVHVKVGDTVYFCWRYFSSDLKAPTTDTNPVSVSYGSGWPK